MKIVNGEMVFKGKIIVMAPGGISFTKNAQGEAPLAKYKDAVEEIKKKLKAQGAKDWQIHVVNDEGRIVWGHRTKLYAWIA